MCYFGEFWDLFSPHPGVSESSLPGERYGNIFLKMLILDFLGFRVVWRPPPSSASMSKFPSGGKIWEKHFFHFFFEIFLHLRSYVVPPTPIPGVNVNVPFWGGRIWKETFLVIFKIFMKTCKNKKNK